MKAQKTYKKKVEAWILAVNLIVMTFVGAVSVFYAIDDYYKYYNACFPVLLTLIYFILFYAVCQIRKTIKSVAYAFPNERLMRVHFINFPIWITLITVETVLGMISGYFDGTIEKETPA